MKYVPILFQYFQEFCHSPIVFYENFFLFINKNVKIYNMRFESIKLLLWNEKFSIKVLTFYKLIVAKFRCFAVFSCSSPLVRKLPNSKITASSEYNKYHAPRLVRLGQVRHRGYVGAWSSRHNNHNQWIKFDFSRPMKITKVDTQGRQDSNQWVTRYLLSSSLDGIHWQIHRINSQDKVGHLRLRSHLWSYRMQFENAHCDRHATCSLREESALRDNGK